MNIQELKNKTSVWQLSNEEIEYIFQKLHMNSYVYVTLKTYLANNFPAGKKLSLNKSVIPSFLFSAAGRVAQLSQFLYQNNPASVRINYTFLSFKLFYELKSLTYSDLHKTIELFASLAFISILADKNDNLRVWKHKPVRDISPELKAIFASTRSKINIHDFILLPLHKNDKPEKVADNPMSNLFRFIPKAMASLIPHFENDTNFFATKEALLNVENTMLRYEKDNNIGGNESFEGGISNPGQIRYRNTLYLYGGNFFERKGELDKAFNWYTKDLLYTGLPDNLGFYLTALKTCERLICAYRVIPDSNCFDKIFYKSLIDYSLLKSFQNAAEYAGKLFEYLKENPNTDISKERIMLNDKDFLLYGGEASREIYLISLMYIKYVLNIDFKKIDYSKYLETSML